MAGLRTCSTDPPERRHAQSRRPRPAQPKRNAAAKRASPLGCEVSGWTQKRGGLTYAPIFASGIDTSIGLVLGVECATPAAALAGERRPRGQVFLDRARGERTKDSRKAASA